jgi:hypothetical protein
MTVSAALVGTSRKNGTFLRDVPSLSQYNNVYACLHNAYMVAVGWSYSFFFILQPSSPTFQPLPFNFLDHLPVFLNQILKVEVLVKFNCEIYNSVSKKIITIY